MWPGRKAETQRVSPALWERCRKTVSAHDTEAGARPVGAKAPFGRLTRPRQGPRSCLTPEGGRWPVASGHRPDVETVLHDLGDGLGHRGG